MALIELVEKAADADLVREMLAFAAERNVDAEAEMLAGAAKGARVGLTETMARGVLALRLKPSARSPKRPSCRAPRARTGRARHLNICFACDILGNS